MIALLGQALAQTYAFPSNAEDYPEFYPTAYVDQGGTTDWNCGSITYAGHRGSDFGGGSFYGMDQGRTITAAAEGTVVATNDGEEDRCTTGDCYGGGGFGNYVYVEHPDGKTTIYGHLKKWSVAVGVGDPVVCGQAIGEMGSSGYSTGPHLHFQVDGTSGYAEDPFDGPCSAPPTYWTGQGAYADLPDLTCDDPPECAPVGTLACGQTVVGANDDAGSTQATWTYGCDEWIYSGPELSWTFATALDEPVTLSLTGLSADLDLHVLASTACDGSDCLAASSNPYAGDEVVTFDATAGVETVVVVDGWEGAVSAFTLTVACDGVLPGSTGETGSETTTDPGTTSGTTDAPPGDTGPISDPGVARSGTAAGCGCGSAQPRGFALLLLAALRRRRHGAGATAD